MFKDFTKDFTKKDYLNFYKYLKLTRRFEEETIKLSNLGEIRGPMHPSIGMEAIGVGVCLALRKEDIITSTHRGFTAKISKGLDIKCMLAELMGRVNGYSHGKGGHMHMSDLNIGVIGVEGSVGGAVPIALGVSLISKLRNKNQVIVAFYGDGAANVGVVHETMNMAAIWNLPIIFVCENNRYAVSTSIKYSTKIGKLSTRARAYGFPGYTVDGMNVFTVYNATKDLAEKARDGKGPFLLECMSYRYQGHFTAEAIIGLKYRTNREIKYWESRDPIKSCIKNLLEEKVCNQSELDKIDEIVENLIKEAVDFARSSKWPKAEDALKDMYAKEYI